MDITAVAITPERFAEGMTTEQFIEGMSKNKELFRERYENYKLRDRDAVELRAIGRQLKVLVLAEDWCGDVLRYVPVFARIADAAETWEVRVFCRDENLDLADMWRKHGEFRAIPVIVFFDEEMNEIACFVEKPAVVYTDDRLGREMFASQRPELEDAGLPIGEMSPTTYTLYVTFIKEYREQRQARWQQLFVDEILEKLGPVYSLEGLVAGIAPENWHGETSTGHAVGEEIR